MNSEENQALLMKILRQHYRERPAIVDQAMKEISNYRSNPNKVEYERTLNKLYDLMNDDLPSNILLYFLTMVPLPTNKNDKSTILELMRKTHDSLLDNIRPVLTEYLKHTNAETECTSKEVLNSVNTATNNAETESQNIKSPENVRELTFDSCKKLVDICAKFVLENALNLKNLYERKNQSVFNVLQTQKVDDYDRKICHAVAKDVAKKRKWLRMIDDEEIMAEVFDEEYRKSSDVFLKKRHLHGFVTEEPFQFSKKLDNAVLNFVNKC